MATSRLSDEKLGIDIMDTALITSMVAPSQLDLINDTILDKKLKTREVADVTRCSKRSIKAIVGS